MVLLCFTVDMVLLWDGHRAAQHRMCSTWPQPLQATNLGKSAMARCCREWRLWRLLVTLSASLQAGEFMSCEIVVDFEKRWISLKKLVAKCGQHPGRWSVRRLVAHVGGHSYWRDLCLGSKQTRTESDPVDVERWSRQQTWRIHRLRRVEEHGTFAQKKHDKTPLWCLSVSFTHWFCLPGWRKMVVRHPPPATRTVGRRKHRDAPLACARLQWRERSRSWMATQLCSTHNWRGRVSQTVEATRARTCKDHTLTAASQHSLADASIHSTIMRITATSVFQRPCGIAAASTPVECAVGRLLRGEPKVHSSGSQTAENILRPVEAQDQKKSEFLMHQFQEFGCWFWMYHEQ